MSIFGWLPNALTNAFSESSSSSRPPLPEKTLELAQKNFFAAIEKEELDTITRIAERYPDDFLKWKSDSGLSPLGHAQRWNSFGAFVHLAGLGADKHEDYGNGWTPLMSALKKNDSTFIDYLLDSKITSINSVARNGEYSYTSLHLAVLNRDGERVLHLIERGADQNVKARPGKRTGEVTPEELAIQMKEPKIAEMLNLAENIREVKRREYEELQAFAAKHAYVPKGEEPVPDPFRGVPGAADDKATTIVVKPDAMPVVPPPAAKPMKPR